MVGLQLTDAEKEKISKINNALDCDPVDIIALRQATVTNGGLIRKDIRARAWPKLMNVNVFNIQNQMQNAKSEKELFLKNKYYRQVQMDINRCNRRFPPGTRVSRRGILKQQLTTIIMRVLCLHDDLHYYQGFHDLAVTLLLVLGEPVASAVLEQLALNHVRDFMDATMERTNKLLGFVGLIVQCADSQLSLFLERSEVGFVYSLSWLITWFGHDIDDYHVIVRLCDFFMASHPIMPLYIGAAMILSVKDNILSLECEMSAVHQMLSRLPHRMNIDTADQLINSAAKLFSCHPPDKVNRRAKSLLHHSSSANMYSSLVRSSKHQESDNTLLKRRVKDTRKHPSLPPLNSKTSSENESIVNNDMSHQLTKVAVWTLSLSVGVMSFIVLNASKRWL